MPKTDNKKPVAKPSDAQKKNKKLPEVEDFFTIFLQKKNRNLEKKLRHITELEQQIADKSNNKNALTKDQQELVDRKPEILKQISENNELKNTYLEAYSKRDNDVKDQPTVKSNVEQVNVQEIEEKAIRKTVMTLSKFVLVTRLLRNQESVNKFAEVSGLADLSSLLELQQNLFESENTDNTELYTSLQETLVNYVYETPVLSKTEKPMNVYVALVNSVLENEHFSSFVPVEPEPKVVEVFVQPEPVMNGVTQSQAEPVQVQSKSVEPEQPKSRSRLESAAQQDIFMADDDDDSEEEEQPVQTEKKDNSNQQVSKPDNSKKAEDNAVNNQENKREFKSDNQQKQPAKANPENSDEEDEWQQVGSKRNYHNQNQQRGRGFRGGRGGNRGGRGFYKDGKRQEGEDGRKLERKDWNRDRPERGEGKDGEKREYRGEYRGRGGNRGRGEYRGRGGRGRGGPREPRDGDRASQEQRPPQGDQGLKEIGVSEKPVQAEQTQASE